jgi:hypothetical protein
MEVIRPNVTNRIFKNMDAALDFCKFAEPDEIHITKLYIGGENGPEFSGVQLQYIGGGMQ